MNRQMQQILDKDGDQALQSTAVSYSIGCGLVSAHWVEIDSNILLPCLPTWPICLRSK